MLCDNSKVSGGLLEEGFLIYLYKRILVVKILSYLGLRQVFVLGKDFTVFFSHLVMSLPVAK